MWRWWLPGLLLTVLALSAWRLQQWHQLSQGQQRTQTQQEALRQWQRLHDGLQQLQAAGWFEPVSPLAQLQRWQRRADARIEALTVTRRERQAQALSRLGDWRQDQLSLQFNSRDGAAALGWLHDWQRSVMQPLQLDHCHLALDPEREANKVSVHCVFEMDFLHAADDQS